jgi:hypothetical protein
MLDLIRGTAKWTQPAFQAIEEPKALMMRLARLDTGNG